MLMSIFACNIKKKEKKKNKRTGNFSRERPIWVTFLMHLLKEIKRFLEKSFMWTMKLQDSYQLTVKLKLETRITSCY